MTDKINTISTVYPGKMLSAVRWKICPASAKILSKFCQVMTNHPHFKHVGHDRLHKWIASYSETKTRWNKKVKVIMYAIVTFPSKLL